MTGTFCQIRAAAPSLPLALRHDPGFSYLCFLLYTSALLQSPRRRVLKSGFISAAND
jgi:hypothetical protein